jgi:hypothetical protein
MITKKQYTDLIEELRILQSRMFFETFLDVSIGKTVINETRDNNLHNVFSSEIITNEEKGEIEEYEFYNYPPNKFTTYINEEKHIITTWTGLKLGDIIYPKVFKLHEYKSGFGDIRINIRVKGINGLEYYGTYFKSAGDYANLKAIKRDKEKTSNVIWMD